MNNLLADADLCVKCGLCLPHCPTYNKTQNENESPRGRIALIQAWAGKHLETSKKLIEHIDNCLLCRSCERVCPAVVPYGRLINDFREQIKGERNATLSVSLLKRVSHNKTAGRLAQSGLKFYQTTALQKTARFLRLPELLRLDKIDRLLPDYHDSTPLAPHYPATAEARGNVGLFIGCMGSLLDHETVNAAIKVLTAAGFNVSIPEQQTCCGALDLHDGDNETSGQLAATNCSAFADKNLDAIVTIASGCGSQMQEYQQAEFAGKVVDISQFLIKSGCDLSDQLQPLAASVCLHTPCSLKNVMREEQGAVKLLQQIPEIKMTSLPASIQCCGSAGSYMLDHPQMAQALLSDLLGVALKDQPEYLVSSNIGCALHISAGLRERGIALEVLHPVTLIARQLK
ncbi:glycolate oxidase iron-sulfur subunit [Methylobacter tundripaludum]|uniref:Glycolate oxidase iron-sulfur subunit n=1 Tax=Methylobacter tundripaludum TaxID=173365 RepID=A0A2S6H9P3_9GAMM|nr:(Fe-S)-binding protein [Methylobacter tundripaludum]PPK74197.1 glycolate oxidase iron-sulfur subunit [Methylobacter tundripaludum]